MNSWRSSETAGTCTATAIATPRFDYEERCGRSTEAVTEVEKKTGRKRSVGRESGKPFSTKTAWVKNANFNVLNGNPLTKELRPHWGAKCDAANDAQLPGGFSEATRRAGCGKARGFRGHLAGFAAGIWVMAAARRFQTDVAANGGTTTLALEMRPEEVPPVPAFLLSGRTAALRKRGISGTGPWKRIPRATGPSFLKGPEIITRERREPNESRRFPRSIDSKTAQRGLAQVIESSRSRCNCIGPRPVQPNSRGSKPKCSGPS